MPNRIQATFDKLRARGQKALIPYIMAGDPSLTETESLVLALEEAGADLIELGVPFSDPIADGPVIQKAAERALRSGTSLKSILSTVKTLRTKSQIPLILMTYYNTIMAMGENEFCEQAVKAGVDGVIVPDLPPEEADLLCEAADKAGGPVVIFLLAPTSTKSRQAEVIKRTKGFIYYVSLTGITGASLSNMDEVRQNVSKIQKTAKKPVAVGFGISTPDQVKQVAEFADGVIVGSAIVRQIGDHQLDSALIERISQFTQGLKTATLNGK
ncbi:MAG: tryptophan synthase subunit alpha [Nitrospirota bacterium]|nr:MAG: tryptophan synthase subunit alpha [Nitrospirota bacterium]